MTLIESLIEELTRNNILYSNGEPTTLTDDEYDKKLLQLKELNPAHILITGVGSAVRGDKVPLPYKMGSLNQAYESETLAWVNDNGLANEKFVVSAKMDGVSTEIIYDDNGNLQIAYTRGNGLEGADIYRHLSKIRAVPKKISANITTPIRAEIIIAKSAFVRFQKECLDRNYKIYKNPRNAVAGLMNSKVIPDWIYEYFDVIAFEIIGNLSKLAQLEQLEQFNFMTVTRTVLLGEDLIDEVLSKAINDNKHIYGLKDYEQDGVVIDVDKSSIRKKMNPSTNSLNPAYAKKFKIRDNDNIAQTTCLGVVWGVSKHGLLKPRVNIEPVELGGVTIDYATGFNAKFILDNYVGKGAVIKITRSGDVIPHILDVITPAITADVPDESVYGSYGLNDTEVDFLLDDPKANETVLIKEISSFFESLDVPKLRLASVGKLYHLGFDTIPKIINMFEDDFVCALGKNGSVSFNGLHEKLDNITVYEFMGALTIFGSGVGKRMFEKIYDHYGQCEDLTIDDIITVDGFEFKTACKIVDNMPQYRELLSDIDRDVTFVDKVVHNGKFDGKVFVFTGFRDKASQEAIELEGGTIGSSVNKDSTYLVTKDPSSTSGKVAKARKLVESGVSNVEIISIDDMLGML